MPNPLEKVVAFAKDKPLVAAGVGGVVLALGAAAFAKPKKKATPAGEYVIPNMLTPGMSGVGFGGTGGSTGGSTGTPPGVALPTNPWWSTPQPLPVNSVPPASTPTTTAPTERITAPLAISQPSSVGVKVAEYQVTNPLGSADRIAAESRNRYTPSLSDYATERDGGITRTIAAKTTKDASLGRTYSVDSGTLGSGAVVPVSQRIAGERYDSLGRVIL